MRKAWIGGASTGRFGGRVRAMGLAGVFESAGPKLGQECVTSRRWSGEDDE
ncbi:MAG: hypothetical protein AAF322_16000 [Pseudomonadota bacterium]